jgi:hypothetical protein
MQASHMQPKSPSLVAAGKQLIALVYGETIEAQAANCRLIKASPDMLEALKALANEVRHFVSQSTDERDTPLSTDPLRRAERAIAKAEGRH